jgi:hypothetical protein
MVMLLDKRFELLTTEIYFHTLRNKLVPAYKVGAGKTENVPNFIFSCDGLNPTCCFMNVKIGNPASLLTSCLKTAEKVLGHRVNGQDSRHCLPFAHGWLPPPTVLPSHCEKSFLF